MSPSMLVEPIATDPVQQCIDAIVETLDTAALVVALTLRGDGNVLALDDLARVRTERLSMAPMIGYEHLTTRRDGGAVGDWRSHRVQFTVEAASRRDVRATLHAIELTLTTANLIANTTTPLDARVVDWVRSGIARAPEQPMYREAMIVALLVKHT